MTTPTSPTHPAHPDRMSVPPPAPAPGLETDLLDQAWELHPSVSVRPEPFGALMYHFGNRRLSFLKTRQLLDIVNGLATAPDARSACLAAGAHPTHLPALGRALASLAAGDLIRPRSTTSGQEPA
ncbi:mycofactocin biosynthesis chaperone MftB [Kineosporia rhizophila]|uniref:mycofactocin biosynthesis chaperone MftB n=2 Tax=Kineosporia TaxID=49184 RepID=UPI001E5412E7|nr:mycofactocin biosynthesis chaperone MftB [Kineosporia rhizophila]MCE0539310.1 mycofactocin biosynthesis chaperone MftB [Kineosporia rhizophila]